MVGAFTVWPSVRHLWSPLQNPVCSFSVELIVVVLHIYMCYIYILRKEMAMVMKQTSFFLPPLAEVTISSLVLSWPPV